jgi:YebC/PmpR family DNA-binding regulatory protein
MSGHSKWHSIKHQKGIADARRGAAFTKLANLVSVAAKKGADPEMNFSLRMAIQKAKAANMPAANIERSIRRGAGLDGATVMEEIMYEGYGPAAVAVLVECATDNRNRTASEVRSSFSKYGGNLGTSGSVAYQFKHQGMIVIEAADQETAELDAIEAGAEDIEEGDGELIVYTEPTQLDAVRKKLVEAGYTLKEAELTYTPTTTVTVTELKPAQTLMKLMDVLDNLDDVTATHANFEIDDAIADQL